MGGWGWGVQLLILHWHPAGVCGYVCEIHGRHSPVSTFPHELFPELFINYEENAVVTNCVRDYEDYAVA
jgi:hypothetical protein